MSTFQWEAIRFVAIMPTTVFVVAVISWKVTGNVVQREVARRLRLFVPGFLSAWFAVSAMAYGYPLHPVRLLYVAVVAWAWWVSRNDGGPRWRRRGKPAPDTYPGLS